VIIAEIGRVSPRIESVVGVIRRLDGVIQRVVAMIKRVVVEIKRWVAMIASCGRDITFDGRGDHRVIMSDTRRTFATTHWLIHPITDR
jgi:hypothetical protein